MLSDYIKQYKKRENSPLAKKLIKELEIAQKKKRTLEKELAFICNQIAVYQSALRYANNDFENEGPPRIPLRQYIQEILKINADKWLSTLDIMLQIQDRASEGTNTLGPQSFGSNTASILLGLWRQGVVEQKSENNLVYWRLKQIN
ncbi:hypothetical protein [Mannheimia indoligenes]|uniref:hypothetical protein n=1 Tax=Mannheimia indoligenes TaxID=3103145 RepID=UPI002FE68158